MPYPVKNTQYPRSYMITLIMIESLFESNIYIDMNVISLFHSLLYKDNNCINMEKYPFYYIASVPLCLPSFFVVFRVIKNKFLKSVFNQQITLMLLLNGNNLKGWIFDIFLGKSPGLPPILNKKIQTWQY